MEVHKLAIRTDQEADKLIMNLGLKALQVPTRQIPGVWVFVEKTATEPGEILAQVSFGDFYGKEEFTRAQNLLHALSGPQWSSSIPYEAYPQIERYTRDLINVIDAIGDTESTLQDDARKAEEIYQYMFDKEVSANCDTGYKYNEAVRRARVTISAHKKNLNAVKAMRDKAKNLYDNLSRLSIVFTTIQAKLRREYERAYSSPHYSDNEGRRRVYDQNNGQNGVTPAQPISNAPRTVTEDKNQFDYFD